ncbi:MAG: Trk system potassium transporter TrkA [Pelagibacterales bacterium]|nr:Trk system potassium transporter TrkA [Pelagibacterales bacterium]MAU29397.1 Trk system potassium transporter TrkA [Pelagibacterales bacterium]RCL82126.1 MAG: Trk system potassium transporter TrkA [Alphaproteobacteria bacterium]|tara:strand:- start:1039 stop:2415 length:1377 start_codon:yes stop_codon:yes gene_type:complete
MNIIICGAGEVGYNIARLLSDEKNEITIIDHDENRIEHISGKLDVRTLIGYASHPNILKEAEADKCDMIIAVTQSDEINMISCQIANLLFKVPIKIARVRSEAYNKEEWNNLFNESLFSIDALISPEQEVAKSFTRLVAVPGAKDMISFDEDLVRLIEINLAEDCPVLNTPLNQLTEIFPDLGARVVYIVRDSIGFVPNKLSEMKNGDDIYIIAESNKTERVLSIFGKETATARRIVIIGGGKTGLRVAKSIEENEPQSNITLIENNKNRAETIADELSKSIILNGDALDKEILEEANIAQADFTFALTASDEINTLSAILAKKYGCHSSAALLSENRYSPFTNSLGIDAVVNPRELTVSRILRYVRRGKVFQVQSLREGEAEVIELEAIETSILIGVPLREKPLPDGVAIGALIRDKTVILPVGTTTIEVGDRVIVFAKHDFIPEIEKIFSVGIGFY